MANILLDLNIKNIIIKGIKSEDDLVIPVLRDKHGYNYGKLNLNNYRQIKSFLGLCKEFIRTKIQTKQWNDISDKDIKNFIFNKLMLLFVNESRKYVLGTGIILHRRFINSEIIYELDLRLLGHNYTKFSNKLFFQFEGIPELVNIQDFMNMVQMTYGNSEMNTYIIRVNYIDSIWIKRYQESFLEIGIKTRLVTNYKYRQRLERYKGLSSITQYIHD